MSRLTRLDVELVRRGLVRSREQATRAIADGRVLVAGLVATKPATSVDGAASIALREPEGPSFVSRGGHKLAGALDDFGPRGLIVAGRHALDAGASTGGFTEVLLRAGAASVTAVDVGYGQLAWRLRSDSRVTILDRTNVRDLQPELFVDPPGLVVADLSFISLRVVLPALARVSLANADYVLLVKPQFEVGKADVGSGGVVRAPALRVRAVVAVIDAAASLGLGAQDVVASALPGPAGNVEYFVWLRRGVPSLPVAAVEAAVESGPQ